MSVQTDESILTDILMEYLYKIDEVHKGVSVGILFMENDLAQIESILSGDKYSRLMEITNRLIKDEYVLIGEYIKYRVYPLKTRFNRVTTMMKFESISTAMKRIFELGLQKKHRLDEIRHEMLDYAQGAPLTPQLVYQNLFRVELGSARRDKIVSKSGAKPIGHVSRGTASTRVIEWNDRIPFSVSDIQEYMNVLCLLGLMRRKGIKYYPR